MNGECFPFDIEFEICDLVLWSLSDLCCRVALTCMHLEMAQPLFLQTQKNAAIPAQHLFSISPKFDSFWWVSHLPCQCQLHVADTSSARNHWFKDYLLVSASSPPLASSLTSRWGKPPLETLSRRAETSSSDWSGESFPERWSSENRSSSPCWSGESFLKRWVCSTVMTRWLPPSDPVAERLIITHMFMRIMALLTRCASSCSWLPWLGSLGRYADQEINRQRSLPSWAHSSVDAEKRNHFRTLCN